MKKILFLILLVVMVTFLSCKKDNPEEVDPVPTDEIIIADETRVVDPVARQSIVSIDTSDFTFVLTGGTDFTSGLSVGSILVDSVSDMAPYGYLRKVTGLTNADGVTTLTTAPAALTEAVHQGSLSFDHMPLLSSKITSVSVAKGVELHLVKNPDFTIFDMDYDVNMEEGNQKLNIQGHTALSLDVFFNFDWSWCLLCMPPGAEVTLFETGIEVHQDASIDLVSQSGATVNETVSIATFYFEPWTFTLGPVPVVFVPSVELFMDANGTVSAEFSVGASESVDGRVGLQYTSDSGWDPINTISYEFDYYAPQLDLDVDILSHVGPKLSLKLYNIAGPYMATLGCSELKAHLYTGTENWDLTYTVGAVGRIGVEVNVLALDWDKHYDICLFSHKLIDISNEPLATAIYFQSPTNGSWLPLGSTVLIEPRLTGMDPDLVELYVDGTLTGQQDTAPWTFSWNTAGFGYGAHELILLEYIGTEVVSSDTAMVELKDAFWESIDMSAYGQSDLTANYDVCFEDEMHGWMSGGPLLDFGGWILETYDGGATWNNIAPSMFTNIDRMVFMGSDRLIMHSVGGYVFSSVNWGNLTYPGDPDPIDVFGFYDVWDIAISSDGNLYSVASHINESGDVIRVVNGAQYDYYPVREIPIPHQTILSGHPKIKMLGNKGLVYNIRDDENILKQYIMVSDNAGASWTDMPLNAYGITRSDRIYDAFMWDENRIWMVGVDDYDFAFVLITTDGGINWEKVDVENAPSFNSVWFLNTTEGYATCGVTNVGDYPDYKLYHTQDGGHTWTPEELSLTMLPYHRVYFRGNELGYAVGQGATTLRFTVGK